MSLDRTWRPQASRRQFLQSAVAVGAAAATPRMAWGAGYRSASERPVLGFIGTGIRYSALLDASLPHGPCAALCDVDTRQLDAGLRHLDHRYAQRGVTLPTPQRCEDYRRVLDRPDIDAVVIATPDHWHAKIAIEALLAGKDVYCEKPLTLTVAEGPQILAALERSGRVMQVGTQQRSTPQFQKAVALARAERGGAVRRATCGIGGCPESGPLPVTSPPAGLNWNRWLGPAPWTEYRSAPERPEGGYGSEHPYCNAHAHFRWWYEYAGGKLTDWGAHHVDIAMWALQKSDASIGRFTVDPIRVDHPVEFEGGYPTEHDRFNTATSFEVRVDFEDGVRLDIVDNSERLKFDNGVMFETDQTRFFVNRGRLTGKPVEELAESPLDDSAFAFAGGPAIARQDGDSDAFDETHAHMKNFFDCVKSRDTPISDVASHHRHLTVCHLANIAMRLGRKLTFDPGEQRIVDDEQANAMLAREPRKGFETEA